MKIKNIIITKLWGNLRKLFKPEREGMLLRRKQAELREYADAKNASKNNIAQATNDNFISQYTCGEGSTNLRDSAVTGSEIM